MLVFICYSFWLPQIIHNVHRYGVNGIDVMRFNQRVSFLTGVLVNAQ